jgi:hypothetical protein
MPNDGTAVDVDRDHNLDLVLFDDLDDSVRILRGRGDGTFAGPIRVAIVHDYSAGAVVDLNRDSSPDLVVALPDRGSIGVLLGSNSGAFGALVEVTTGNHPSSLATGDFNGDGKPDLVAAGVLPTGLVVLLGDGTGTFAAPTPYATARYFGLTVSDLDADGRDDLVTSHYFGFGFWRGKGDGMFEPERVYHNFGGLLGDLNGDARPELVEAGAGLPATIYTNNGCLP